MFQKDQFGWKELTVFMIVAYLFSFAIRMIWVWQFKDAQSFYWNGQLMINTNDGYFFASLSIICCMVPMVIILECLLRGNSILVWYMSPIFWQNIPLCHWRRRSSICRRSSHRLLLFLWS